MKRLLAGTAALGAVFALNVLPAAAQSETYPAPTNPPPSVQPTAPFGGYHVGRWPVQRG